MGSPGAVFGCVPCNSLPFALGTWGSVTGAWRRVSAFSFRWRGQARATRVDITAGVLLKTIITNDKKMQFIISL